MRVFDSASGIRDDVERLLGYVEVETSISWHSMRKIIITRQFEEIAVSLDELYAPEGIKVGSGDKFLEKHHKVRPSLVYRLREEYQREEGIDTAKALPFGIISEYGPYGMNETVIIWRYATKTGDESYLFTMDTHLHSIIEVMDDKPRTAQVGRVWADIPITERRHAEWFSISKDAGQEFSEYVHMYIALEGL